jgi:AraC-like DNA-binding protein
MSNDPVKGMLQGSEMLIRCASPSLTPYFGCLWAIPGAPDARIWTVPDGCTSLRVEFHPRGAARGVFSGPRVRPAWFVPPPMTDLVGVRLRPATAFALLRTPIYKLVECEEALPNLFGPLALGPIAEAFQKRIADAETRPACGSFGAVEEPDARSYGARFDVLEEFLSDLVLGIELDARVTSATRMIIESNGEVRIREIARNCGISKRQLERLMLRWVGLSPKRLSRILRFQSLFGSVVDDAPPSWTRVAAEFYSDQSQLVREFTEFAGESPRRFFHRRAPGSVAARCD